MELFLRYNKPAPNTDDGWEKYSMPIGCGWLGGNVFGDVASDRIQVTENSVENPGSLGGLNSLADIYLHFPHSFEACTGYERGLDIGTALAYVQYTQDGVQVRREYFASYPDRALAGRVTASAPIDCTVEVQISHLTDEEGRQKIGTVTSEGDTITMQGTMYAFNVHFASLLKVTTDGTVTAADGKLAVTGATKIDFVFCAATNYELRPEVFTETDNRKKIRDFDPMPQAMQYLAAACAYDYDQLRRRQRDDHSALFNKVSLDLGETDIPELMTDELLKNYSAGQTSRYLEVLYFQYGRYLLISSSRPGTLPANLQGVWNCHDKSPWGSGYWHNINVQMNYWPAFITGIGETFDAYRDYNLAFRRAAEGFAAAYIQEIVPENYSDVPGECGWLVGTGNYAYNITGTKPRTDHSGPGTGGLTSKLFWEYYAFTGDKRILREVAYPALLDMAKFLTKTVRDYDGLQLSVFSASPEQILTNSWGGADYPTPYYHTVGCAFDQQMIWENGRDLLACVDILGEENLPPEDLEVIRVQREQISRYDPVQVGWSGQIKEYREEHFYGEFGEYRHRHISQLVGLYPGTSISHDTPAWLDAAKVSLNLRSDVSTGWALAHRLNAWARTGDGNRAYRLFNNLLGMRTLPNLWDTHPPFQIDGNLGGTSGVAEMLVQSHESYIVPLAALPDIWNTGKLSGMGARGGFTMDIDWADGCAKTITVHSMAGEECSIHYPGIGRAVMDFDVTVEDADHIRFATQIGGSYAICAIPAHEKKPVPTALRANRALELGWDFDEPVNVWRAVNSAPGYDLIARNVTGGAYQDTGCPFDSVETVTYKITRADTLEAGAPGACVTLNHSTKVQREQYRYLIRQLNLSCDWSWKGSGLGPVEAEEYLGE